MRAHEYELVELIADGVGRDGAKQQRREESQEFHEEIRPSVMKLRNRGFTAEMREQDPTQRRPTSLDFELSKFRGEVPGAAGRRERLLFGSVEAGQA